MKTLAEQDVFDKKFAYQIAMMIESELITPRYYIPWAQEIISNTPATPDWIRELTLVKTSEKAVEIVKGFVYAEPLEASDHDVYVDEFLSCLYLRFIRREISYATFLQEAADFTDGSGYRYQTKEIENFYHDISDLEASGFSEAIEQKQREKFERDYATAIASIKPLYLGFLEYFRRNSET